MYLVVIPFLLAANVMVNDTEVWPQGAEYTYRGVMGVTPDYTDLVITSNMTFVLKCRNKDSWSLVCYLSKFKVYFSEPTIDDLDIYSTVELKDAFEIVFNQHGVEGIVTSKAKSHQALDALKTLAALFSAGTDLKRITEPHSIFMAMENYTMGECDTAFNISTYTSDDPDSISGSQENPDYDLTMLPLKKHKGVDGFYMEKVRYPARCNNVKQWLDDSSEKVPSLKTKSSVSTMNVNANGMFRSENIYHLISLQRKRSGPKVMKFEIKKFMNIELYSIKQAMGDFPALRNRVNHDIFVTERNNGASASM